MTTTPARPPAVVVGDYTLLAKIGEGGMGIVHLARRADGQRVALKLLRPHIVGDDEARHRLAREVSSLRRIRSRWVAEIVDADPWAVVPYVATRYVPGLSLHDHVVEEGPVDGRDLVHFATCLAQGVASVHRAGVLHRDVKPSNVLMEGRTPILIDFGLARVADDPRLTHTGWLLGTPGYLAPEILYGDDATTASDVHSWAATVAYAATGRAPFGRGPSMAIMDRVRRGEHDLSGVPGTVRGLLAAALSPEPVDRPTLADALDELRAVEAGVEPRRPRDTVEREVRRVPDRTAVRGPRPLAPPVQHTRVLATTPQALPQALPRALPRVAARPEPVARERVPEAWLPLEPEPTSTGLAERTRRAVLLVLVAGVLGLLTAAFPWWSLGFLVVAVWLVRSGSLAASAAGERRRLRGSRWYDGPLLLVRTPWDVVRSLPGSILLVLWSGGLAVSAALICYALATSIGIALGVTGAAFAASLWTGPGGSRVRGPVSRVVHPLSRSAGPWVAAVAVLALLGATTGLLLADRGPSWGPGSGSPVTSLYSTR